ALHLPALPGPFLYDDLRFVRDNAALRDPSTFLRAFFDPLTTDPTGSGGGIYRPLRTAAFAALVQVFGPDPRAFHAASVLLHGLNALLVLAALRAVLGLAGVERAAAVAFWAALAFAGSPVQGEAIDWISSFDDLLFATFVLVALLEDSKPAAAGRDVAVAAL